MVAADETPQTPREKFTRLAEARMIKTLASIGLVGQLANKSVYDYEESDVDKIEKALTDAVTETVTALRTGKQAGPTFSL